MSALRYKVQYTPDSRSGGVQGEMNAEDVVNMGTLNDREVEYTAVDDHLKTVFKT